ncbi:MAG: glutamate racemase [Candidatus Zixiibacteriota bacterium]
MKDRPIGVFDSGVGGLTVVHALRDVCPRESIVYFGDTGRYPYGVRSKRVIVEFSRQLALFLEREHCKFLIVACNTASALALEEVRQTVGVDVIGVIEPGAAGAVRATRNNHIGIIGTEATINSASYVKAIHALKPDVKVSGLACPLFVALAEEGYSGKEATRLVAEEYLKPLRESGVDTLVLGCTHYPLLKSDIASVMGPGVTLIDSATEVARVVGERLRSRNHHSESCDTTTCRYFVSDTPEKFARVGKRFLGHDVAPVTLIDLESLHQLHDTTVSPS